MLGDMDLGSPVMDVAPAVRGALLRELARLEQPVTRRQLATLAGVSPGHASSVIEGFVSSGLVHEAIVGRASLVALNRRHLAAGPVLALAGLRSELIDRLRDRLGSLRGMRAAWLFGSVARGDAGSSSDVDLLVVVDDLEAPDLRNGLTLLAGDVLDWTGNALQVVEHTPTSWRRLLRSGNGLVDEVRRDGIALAGDPKPLLARSR
ncbi:unannotated protein [freshwater metagenome]|uniref:Unannotated protein n=1 Tax=freshwater metagenome TaxID=449393 RepID=A0A6J6Z3Y0_9ZZZZ